MFPGYIVIASCLELLAAEMTINSYAGLPFYNNSVDCSAGCTTTTTGGPVEYEPGSCFLPVHMDDPYYDSLWCQPITVEGDNGPVNVSTPCNTDPNVFAAPDAPYGVRVFWANQACWPYAALMGWCEVENVCTAADKLNGDCTCTAAEQANNECTP